MQRATYSQQRSTWPPCSAHCRSYSACGSHCLSWSMRRKPWSTRSRAILGPTPGRRCNCFSAAAHSASYSTSGSEQVDAVLGDLREGIEILGEGLGDALRVVDPDPVALARGAVERGQRE